MSKLKTKHKVLLIVFSGVIGTVAVLGFFMWLTLVHTNYGRIYNEYADLKDEFEYFNVTIEQIHIDEESHEAWFTVATADVNDYLQRYDKYGPFGMPYGGTDGFLICGKTFDQLLTTDFFDVLDENTVVTIYTYWQYHWEGWRYPIAGVSIGDNVYVDFDTGYQNWLDWLMFKSEEAGVLQSPIKDRNVV